MEKKRRVGILGYGKLGQYLSNELLNNPAVNKDHELAFVWNRTPEKVGKEIPSSKRIINLQNFIAGAPDLIVEVCDPSISSQFGAKFLEHVDFMMGSPTAMADDVFCESVTKAAYKRNKHGLYIPRGAMPGLEYILNKKDKWTEGEITMRKHPSSINFYGSYLKDIEEELTLYDGNLRALCCLAPNNVNTMAVFALASGLGFDEVRAKLVADPALEHHVVEISVRDKTGYEEGYIRKNPAAPGARTGLSTFKSFLDSMVKSYGVGKGIHFR